MKLSLAIASSKHGGNFYDSFYVLHRDKSSGKEVVIEFDASNLEPVCWMMNDEKRWIPYESNLTTRLKATAVQNHTDKIMNQVYTELINMAFEREVL